MAGKRLQPRGGGGGYKLTMINKANVMAQMPQRRDLLLHILVVCTFVVIMWALHSIVFDIVNQQKGGVTSAQRKFTRGSLLNH
jgi:hypothetical protein